MSTKTDTKTADIDARIVKAIRGTKGGLAAKDIATAVDLAYSTLTPHLRRMVEAGTLVAETTGRTKTFTAAKAITVTKAERAAAADGSSLRAADAATEAAAKAPRKRGKAAPAAQAAESAVAASDAPAGSKAPAKAPRAGSGKLGAVLDRLETVRPTPPAAEPKAKAKRAPAAKAVTRSWKHGELRDTVLTWFRQNAGKKGATPGECARAIQAFQQPVATNCARLTTAGSLVQVPESKPIAYRPA